MFENAPVGILSQGDQGEFVSADPDRVILRTEDSAHAIGDQTQDGIARRMAVIVVDLLEPVDIDHGHGDGFVG